MTVLNKTYRKAQNRVFNILIIFTILFVLLLAACAGGNSSPEPTPPSQALDKFIISKNFSGVVLARKDNKDILRKAYGFSDKSANIPNTLQTRFRIASLTKAFTALGVVQLKQDGLIANYSDPVTTYLPMLSLNSQITIEQLLTHRSGIPDFLATNRYDPSRSYTPLEFAALFDTDPLNFTPGSEFEYSNANYFILGVLIERLSGQSYYDYLQTNIFNPLGLSATEEGKSIISGDNYAKGYTSSAQDTEADFIDMSIPFSAGALSSNLSDMQSWALSFDDLSLITQQDYEEIFANEDYGFGWGTTPIEGKNAYWHTGGISGFDSVLVILPDDNGLIIVLGNVESLDSVSTGEEIAQQILKTEF